MTFIVSYDLNKPGQDYNSLFDGIKSLGAWAHPLDSTWIVDTAYSAAQIRDLLWAKMDSSDRLLVGEFGSAWAAVLSPALNEWLNQHVRVHV